MTRDVAKGLAAGFGIAAVYVGVGVSWPAGMAALTAALFWAAVAWLKRPQRTGEPAT